MFFFILVPPIMLKSVFELHRQEFINNISTVLLHGVLGTIINFLLIGGCLCISNHFRPEYIEPSSEKPTHAAIFLFSSFICAVGN